MNGHFGEWEYRSQTLALVKLVFGIPYGLEGVLGVPTGELTTLPEEMCTLSGGYSPHPNPAIQEAAGFINDLHPIEGFQEFREKARALATAILFDRPKRTVPE